MIGGFEGGLLGFAVLLALVFVKCPIGFAMAFVGFLGLSYFSGIQPALKMIGAELLHIIQSYDMAVVVLFILMGELAANSGLSTSAYKAAFKWFGSLRGGLAMASIVACSAFAAVSGSSPATAATIGSMAFPEMKRYGYDDGLATGSVAAGGTLGILIPPSAGFILYGILTEQSIRTLFTAGILPGLLLTFLFLLAILIFAKKYPHKAPSGPSSSMKEKFSSLLGIIDVALIFMLVIGGMIAGYFTPTEAGAVGAVGVLVLSIIKRNISWKGYLRAINRSVRTGAMIILIFVGAMIFTRFLAISTLPFQLGDLVKSFKLPPVGAVIIIVIIWMILGCIMDAIAMIVLTIPVFYPIVSSLDFDPIWFGVITVISIEMGLITPPIGLNVYVIHGIAQEVPIHVIFKGVVPFIIAMCVALALVIIFPQIALFLPGLLK